MAVRIHLTKRGKIIILASLMLILAGTGGYLLWRVNQDDTVAPTDSEASGGAGACCNAAGCVAGYTCDNSKPCSSCENAYANAAGASCGTLNGVTVKCRNGFTCTDSSAHKCCPTNPLGTCVKVVDPEAPIGGTCPDSVKACEWPNTIMSNTCSCEKCNGSNGCSGNPPTCTPGGCPDGKVSCGDSTNHDGGSDCVKQSSVSCAVYHPDCNNPSNIYRYCKPATATNVCDSGAWVTKPTGSYAYCAPISYSATATDTDGIDQTSISVKLNSTSRSSVTKSNVGTTTTISETLSSATKCLTPGSYTLAMDWKDTKGATGSNCALSTTFTVQPEVLNPDWSLTKGVVEKCIDERTANPTSQLTYTITIKNTGAGEGTITKIGDSLDSKVLQTYISGISNSGVYANGDITWTLSTTEKVFAANQSKVFTYVVTVPKDKFGAYANTVTAYPATGENIIANANIDADCVIEAPDTGMFDSVWAKVLLGIAFIAIGMNYSHISRFSRKLHISINDGYAEQRKKNFEKKVVKR